MSDNTDAREILLSDAIEEAIEGRRAELRLKKLLCVSVALNIVAALFMIRKAKR